MSHGRDRAAKRGQVLFMKLDLYPSRTSNQFVRFAEVGDRDVPASSGVEGGARELDGLGFAVELDPRGR